MQGVVIVVLGIALIYLVLSGKLDCLIAAFRACAGADAPSQAGGSWETPSVTPGTIPTNPTIEARKILDGVLRA